MRQRIFLIGLGLVTAGAGLAMIGANYYQTAGAILVVAGAAVIGYGIDG